ncbi:MAG: hypothetical protein K940chlam7_01081, partial [Chlamydiae bacterium]|nr:hypothetical protein [Chlamydiota bacterium]
MVARSENVDSVYNFFCTECDDPEEGLNLKLLEKKVKKISRDVLWSNVDKSDSSKIIEIKRKIKQLKREKTTTFKGIDIKKIRIVAPDSAGMKVFYALTLIPRIIFVFARSIAHVIMFGISSIWYKNERQNSRKIEKKFTPILFIHGMSANQRQFDITRLFLEKHNDVGHVFTLNLNKSPFNNDEDASLEIYAQKVDDYILSIKQRYAKEGYDLKDVIIVGHSMGGLVAGQYAENQGKQGHLAT